MVSKQVYKIINTAYHSRKRFPVNQFVTSVDISTCIPITGRQFIEFLFQNL